MNKKNQSPLKKKTLFWDVDLDGIEEYGDFIIERILEKGNLSDVFWVLNNYSEGEIIRVVRNSRSISPRTASFWKAYFNIKEPILCLSKPYRKRRNLLWRE